MKVPTVERTKVVWMEGDEVNRKREREAERICYHCPRCVGCEMKDLVVGERTCEAMKLHREINRQDVHYSTSSSSSMSYCPPWLGDK